MLKKYWIILSNRHEEKFGAGPYKFKRFPSRDDAVKAAKECAHKYGFRFDVPGVETGLTPEMSEVKFEGES